MPKRAGCRRQSVCVTTRITSRLSRAPRGRPSADVPIEQIDANPNQPRQVMGDLSELMASIAEKGSSSR